VLAHGGQAERRDAVGLDFVVSRRQSVEKQDFFHLQGVGGVGRVDDEGLVAQVFDGFDVRLRDEFVLRAFATGHDDDVGFRELHHCYCIVDGGVGHVAFAGGQLGAEFVGAGRIVGFDGDAVFGE
jgi:hypothetical protein